MLRTNRLYFLFLIPIFIFISFANFATIYADQSATDGPRLCPGNMFLCSATQRCIPRSWLCDQENDCPDGEDEKNCDQTPKNQCGPQEYQCQNTQHGVRTFPDHPWLAHLSSSAFAHTCIPLKWRCDGEADCLEKDDEMNCDNSKPKCDPKTHFECKGFDSESTSCIPIEWRCDGQTDCLDMKDEQNCTDEIKKKQECDKDTEFRCNDGQCIYKSWRCDGDHDCTDESDEKNCEKDACSEVGKFKCKTNNFCIPVRWRCDGEADCPDHSDETECKEMHVQHEVTCKKDEFRCDSRTQCISKFWQCDGDHDCFDKSDEKNCTDAHPKECKPNERACQDKTQCVDAELWCDHTEDCSDGSDEANCTAVLPTETCNNLTQFTCPGEKHRCIKFTDFCDGMQKHECVVTKGLCNQEHKFCTPNGNPDDACVHRKMSSRGQIYHCADGFKPKVGVSNNPFGECVDIDECEQPGSCDQICINERGSYRCDCYPGYKLIPSENTTLIRHKCRAIGPDPQLLLANRAAIRQFDIATNKYHPLISKLESAVALDYWHQNKTLVWSDVSKEQIIICAGINGLGGHALLASISSICAEGSSNLTVIKDNVTTPDGLAVDWVHGLLFWTDTGRDTINVYDMNTKKRRVLLDERLDEPRAIAVDPSAGLIFWTDWGQSARIERAGMDGQNRQVIVQGNAIRWPNGLALDILEKRIYWADAKTKQISTSDYWGQNMRVILHSNLHIRHPFSLAMFEERLYWTDWDQEGVLSVNKFHGKDVKQIMKGVSGPMTVRVYHQQAQPNQTNKCDNHNCEHFCLPRALYQKNISDDERPLHGVPYSCACDTGFRIDINNKSLCIPLDPIAALSEVAADGVEASRSFTYFIGLLFLSVIMIAAFVYYRRQPRHFSVLHFENPIYRRTVEAMDLDAELENTGGMGDNSLGPISVLPVGQQSGGRAVQGPNEPQAKLVLNNMVNMNNPEEYGYDQPPPAPRM